MNTVDLLKSHESRRSNRGEVEARKQTHTNQYSRGRGSWGAEDINITAGELGPSEGASSASEICAGGEQERKARNEPGGRQ